MTSCESMIEEKPFDFIVPEDVEDSDNGADMWVTGVYNTLHEAMFRYGSFPRPLDYDCDYISGAVWQFSQFGSGNFQGGDGQADVLWTGMYSLINRANIAVSEINKMQNVSPDLIDLHLTENGWIVDENSSTPERTVLYYTKALPVGETTPALSDTIRVNESIAQDVTKQVDGNTIRYTYKYDGYSFHVDAEVDAVQTHNAQEAIKSAWGVDVSVNDDETVMSLQ